MRKALDAIKFQAIREPAVDFKEVSILFLPREVAELRKVIELVEKQLEKEETFVLMRSEYVAFFTAMAEVKESLNVRNSGAALMALIRAGQEEIARRTGQPTDQNG